VKTVINITRHRNTYLRTLTRDGVQGKPGIIPRELAEEIIRANNAGKLPMECNLDVTTPRRWSWQVEVEEEVIDA
jgi:hypothetical protein